VPAVTRGSDSRLNAWMMRLHWELCAPAPPLARTFLAKGAWVSDGGSVDEQYYRQQIKVVDERLALAGLRLAAVLNEVLGHVSPQEFRH